MCFFKAPKAPEMPKVEPPQPKPTITETAAPAPQALVIGDEKAAGATDDTKAKKGTGSLKIDLKAKDTTESGDANVVAGANRSLGGGGPARAKKAVSKGPTM